ncbi:MAG: molybdenum cofactor guanylyltransferase [Desulfovibrio sp.]|jgi:molybdopterin-guanine dinucleotide biosynthesis protein A|nr:molybdenum cofactor guanylyltransferase [Desulfovibrio sp.]
MQATGSAHSREGVVGVVLAGGKSLRLGRDKALLQLHGEGEPCLLLRTAGLLRAVCGEVVIAGRKVSGWRHIPDPGLGPAGGIAAALEHSGRACLVLPCDLPFMTRPVLETLLEARARGTPDTLLTAYKNFQSGRVEFLVAVYEQGALPYFQAGITLGLLKTGLMLPEKAQRHIACKPENDRYFFNINTPADLSFVLRRQKGMLRGNADLLS